MLHVFATVSWDDNLCKHSHKSSLNACITVACLVRINNRQQTFSACVGLQHVEPPHAVLMLSLSIFPVQCLKSDCLFVCF